MTYLRQLGLQKLQRCAVKQQSAQFSSISDFVKNLKSTIESNPEVKKGVDQLKRTTEELSERAREAARDASKAAGQAFQQQTGGSEGQQGAGSAGPGSATATGQSGSAGDEQASTSGRGESTGGSTAGAGGATGPRPTVAARLKRAFDAVKKEVADAVLPREQTTSATRARDPSIRPAGNPQSSGITLVKPPPESKWQKQWMDMQQKLGTHPIFQRMKGLSDNRVFNKGREVADDMRERWETSDSALVQRFQDMKESLFTETEPAQALREIRSRYPGFDMASFVRELRGDVPLVIRAYLEGDLDTLKQHCSKEMMERFTGMIAAQKAEGLTTDSTILDVGDVELVDLKFVEGDPVVVVQFTCQQINCSRDRFGNVVEGGPQDVQRVYYFWALQQEDAGFVGTDGNFHPPRWQLREMMVRGMHNLL